MNRYICIHGHFYQPPRENPWLEEIEFQESAYPYKNWNERITAECYLPNTTSRILNAKDKIVDIVNNYAKMSFNFGPTLLSWLKRHAHDVYQAILEADQKSKEYFSGHGAALAQPYNHMIMPLANPQDKYTQVIWGIKDFEFHFKRSPEGMWLPETAVDFATLEILAEHNIKFTILAPRQAKRVRKIGETLWQDVSQGTIDPQRPYVCHLPSGKTMILFFYDGSISLDVAFGNLLNNGEMFAGRLISSFSSHGHEAPLAHIATDGETYGHHHRFGNMALSYAIRTIEQKKLTNLTIYGAYLEKIYPTHEVEIIENSSWSCAHGVGRWREDCGCRIGAQPSWNQKWRKPLRETLDLLRDELNVLYQKEMALFVPDPWLLRNQYIDVILNRSKENVEKFFNQHIQKSLVNQEKVKILKLLEMMRHAMLMYTSCGWFFDDISGIESTQILQYASRALQLAKEVTGIDLEGSFIKRLEEAPSNIAEFQNGSVIYQRFVKPLQIDLLNVAAHYAISSLFESYPHEAKVYTYSIQTESYEEEEAGRQKLALGKVRIQSMITWEEEIIHFAVLHLGDHNLNAGVHCHSDEENFQNMRRDIRQAFLTNDIPDVIRLMNRYFGDHNYSLWDLFKNEQGKVLDQILQGTLQSIESHYRQIYDDYYNLMQIKKDIPIALPKALAMTVEFILTHDLTTVLEQDDLDLKELERLTKEIKRWAFMRDKDNLSFKASQRINQLMRHFLKEPENFYLLKKIESVLKILSSLSLNWDVWEAQNVYFLMAKRIYPSKIQESPLDPRSKDWIEKFRSLGEFLKVECDAQIG